jgi:Putative adhesin
MRSETFSTPGHVKLEVNIPTGDLDVETAETETTSVELEVRGPDADQHEREAQIELRQRGDRYEVVVAARRSGLFSFRNREYIVRITAPLGADLEANVASADVDGRGRFGDVEINTASGDVELEHVEGRLDVDSASGDVDVRRAGSAKVNSASGDVTIDETATGADVNTASGDVDLRTVRAGAVTINSASGDVDVGIAKGSRLWVEAQSLSGETSSELELESGAPIASDEGPLVELKARTLSGDITVKRA